MNDRSTPSSLDGGWIESDEQRTPSREDWDARYDRVSNLQLESGRRVMSRLAPLPHERIVDLGCGTGRITSEISAAVPDGFVVGLDPSGAMLQVARKGAAAMAGPVRAGRVQFVRADGHDIERLLAHLRSGLLRELTGAAASGDPPFTLDYCRLNIHAYSPLDSPADRRTLGARSVDSRVGGRSPDAGPAR